MDQRRKFLILDTETGGIDPEKHSILSVAGFGWSMGEEPVELFDILIREDPLWVDARSMDINHIDLNRVVREGLDPKDAVELIDRALLPFFGESKACLVGHNIGFDIAFLKKMYTKAWRGKRFDDHFAYRSVDTSTILTFLMEARVIPSGKPSSDRMFEMFGIEVPEEDRHTARGDALATVKAFEAMIRLVDKL